MDPNLVFGAVTGLERQRREAAGTLPRRPSPWRRTAASTLQRIATRLDPPG